MISLRNICPDVAGMSYQNKLNYTSFELMWRHFLSDRRISGKMNQKNTLMFFLSLSMQSISTFFFQHFTFRLSDNETSVN